MIPKDAAELLFQLISECYEPLAFFLFGTIICLASNQRRATMKKTVLVLIIIVALVLSLAACNSGKKGRFHVQKDRENSLFFKPVFLRLPSPQ